jgi:biopolymer transport protein ExbD
MSFSAFGESDTDDTFDEMAEINMVPLIDVMLVLLVIFIVAAPLLTHTVALDLPRASATAQPTPPESVKLAIDSNGHVYWDKEILPLIEIEKRLTDVALRAPTTEVQLRADAASRYERVAQVLAASTRAGLTRVGFVTDPRAAQP